MVGTSGNARVRFLLVTASARSLPSLTGDKAGAGAAIAIEVCPATAEPIAKPALLNGTWTRSRPRDSKELLAYKMSRCTWAAGTVTIFARMSIDEGDEVLDRVGRQRWIDREHNSRGDRERYRIEIVMRIVGNLVVQAGIDDLVGWNDHHRVTVGCRLCRSGCRRRRV